MLADDIPFSLYVHVPWCVKKCPYCDFNSHALRGEVPEAAYIDALLADLDREVEARFPRTLNSIFIGGGTPSLLSPDSVARLLEGVGARLPLSPDCEVTLEANPGTVEAGRFGGFRQAGVNRLSIGVQSFHDDLLSAIGRIHDARQSRLAVENARDAGFENLNLDLMFGLPGQSVAQALKDVDTAIALSPTHISHYQLTIEPNTLFHRHPPVLPGEEPAWQMGQRCAKRLAASGYARYEISAFARAGHECRHNLNYWEFGDYLGIGAGAHGKISDAASGAVVRSLKHRHPRAYLDAARNGSFDFKRDSCDRDALPLEFMMNALRIVRGFDLDLFVARTGMPATAIQGGLEIARSRKLIRVTDARVEPTSLGLRFLNELLLLFASASSQSAVRSAAV
jgi:oxygen-independent coproporphyrinogen-3 oxidase